MDIAIVDLATKVLAILLPFVVKGAEEFAGKVGDATYEKTKSRSGDKEATETLAHFVEKPERYKLALEDILQEKLAEDKDLASKLSQLLNEIGPVLEIVQQMEDGKNITGLKAKEMRGGTAKVTQDITNAEGVTGAEFDTIG